MTTYNTRMTRGQTKVMTFTVRDSRGRLVDLTLSKCYLAFRADIKVAPSVMLTSDATLPADGNIWRLGIVIAPDQVGQTKGQFTSTLIPADTSSLVALGDDDPWIYDVWIVDPVLGTVPVLERSTMGLYPEVTTLPSPP